MKLGALVSGAIVLLVPVVTGAVFFLNPILGRSRTSGGDDGEPSDDGFRRVGSTAGLTRGGAPVMFQVRGVKQDAWTTYPGTTLGAVYVSMLEDGTLRCLNARCTHLGCTVNFRADNEKYICPCHDSSFDLEGNRSNDIPPRNLDALDVEIRNETEIWVRFMNFRTGDAQQIPIVV